MNRRTLTDHGVMGDLVEGDSYDVRKFKEHPLHSLR